MEQPPPLSPQEISQMSDAQNAQLGQPQTVKVFGILHIVFAAIGILTSIWAIIIAATGNPFIGFGAKTPAMQAQAQAQIAMQEQMMSVNIASTVLTLVIAGLMLYAGILLLKNERAP